LKGGVCALVREGGSKTRGGKATGKGQSMQSGDSRECNINRTAMEGIACVKQNRGG